MATPATSASTGTRSTARCAVVQTAAACRRCHIWAACGPTLMAAGRLANLKVSLRPSLRRWRCERTRSFRRWASVCSTASNTRSSERQPVRREHERPPRRRRPVPLPLFRPARRSRGCCITWARRPSSRRGVNRRRATSLSPSCGTPERVPTWRRVRPTLAR